MAVKEIFDQSVAANEFFGTPAAVTQVFAAAVMVVVYLSTDWSLGASLAVMLPIVVGFSYWSLPRFMATWVAVEYLTDRANQEPWAG